MTKAIKYTLWFDICSTDTTNQIISNYKIKTNIKGDSILQKWNIPKEFPAVIKSKKDYPYYYFAGDFADNPISMRISKYKHIDKFNYLFDESNTNAQRHFFWDYHRPLLSTILNDYYKNLK